MFLFLVLARPQRRAVSCVREAPVKKINRTFKALAAMATIVGACSSTMAGRYAAYNDPAGQVAPTAVKAWAAALVDYSPAPGVTAANASASQALGASDGGTVSLGDLDETQIAGGVLPGALIVKFELPIVDKAGPDLAVFENAGTFFTAPYVFAELAYVEVSSNGTDFARFPSVSLNIEPDTDGVLEANEIDAQFGRNFAAIDSTNVYNLAGVHPGGVGTPFDLSDLVTATEVVSGAVDLSRIRYVRLVDIPGNGAFLDSQNNPILDAWLTVGSGGFDLDAVGALNVPEPASIFGALACAILLWLRKR